MLARIATVAFNTYREALRARVLHGLFGLAVATTGYALVVGAYASRSRMRVVSDFGSASISIYAIAVAIVLGATSLYREIELKTVFPILARPIRRSEYLVGKVLGTVLTLAIFVATNAGVLLLCLSVLAGRPLGWVAGGALLALGAVVAASFKLRRFRTLMPIPAAIVCFAAGFVLASPALDDRSVVASSAFLTLCEVAVVTSLATLFASFSSPFLTAMFTLGLFVVGRSADALVKLPEKTFGAFLHELGVWVGSVVPNLMLYVPARPLLTGEAAAVELSTYLASAAGHALGWSVLLLALSSIIFQRRDFL